MKGILKKYIVKSIPYTRIRIQYIIGDGNLDPFGRKYIHYFLDSLVSPCLQLLDKIEDRFDTRQVIRSVSHFVYELVEFVIVLGHGQRPILSNKSFDKFDVKERLFS